MENAETIETIRKAAAGDGPARAALWDQYGDFIRMMANKRKAAADLAGYGYHVEADDLVQDGFFALIKAAETFDPDMGVKYITWLNNYLINEFNAALGLRKRRDLNDPINKAESLDKFLPGYDDISLSDIVPDPADPFTEMIEDDYRRSVLSMIRESINTLRVTDESKQLLNILLDKGFSITHIQAYKIMKPSCSGGSKMENRVRLLYRSGIEALRKELAKKNRRAYFENYYYPYSFRTGAAGFLSWYRSGCSAVELDVIKRDELRRHCERVK